MNIHAQQDFYAVKMEKSKIIKNTVHRKNPIIQEKINHVRCEAKATAKKPCKNRGRTIPWRYTTTDAKDATGTEHIKVANLGEDQSCAMRSQGHGKKAVQKP